MVIATSFLALILVLMAEVVLLMEVWVRSVRDLPAEYQFGEVPVRFEPLEPVPVFVRLDPEHFRYEPERHGGLNG